MPSEVPPSAARPRETDLVGDALAAGGRERKVVIERYLRRSLWSRPSCRTGPIPGAVPPPSVGASIAVRAPPGDVGTRRGPRAPPGPGHVDVGRTAA